MTKLIAAFRNFANAPKNARTIDNGTGFYPSFLFPCASTNPPTFLLTFHASTTDAI